MQFGFKDFENVFIRANSDINDASRPFKKGETIAHFETIQIAGLDENVRYVAAKGGFDNRAHVFWETTKEMPIVFSRGVLSKNDFALLSNSRMLEEDESEQQLFTMRERLETDEYGSIICKYTPVSSIYLYDADTGAKLNFTQLDKTLTTDSTFKDVIVDYQFDYAHNSKCVKIGNHYLKGFVSLEARTRVKDDQTGIVTTAIIKIPQLKILSNLSLRLGSQADPVVGTFRGVGVPVGTRGASYVSEFYFLEDDIESDI